MERFDNLPRARLFHRPTPLDRLDRFSEAVGTEIWMKRDDVGSIATAGNKVRKYEFVLGAAMEAGADTLITTGAARSNSARAGAAAAATLGMRCVLVLSGEPPANARGNELIDRLVGAEIRYCGDVSWDELDDTARRLAAEIAADGGKPVTAPVGCSSPLGSLGFAAAFDELDAQLTALELEPTAIVHTSSSGGTHAGLLVGRARSGRDVRVVGIDVAAMWDDPRRPIGALARDAGALIGLAADDLPTDESIDIDTRYIGPGYGIDTAAANDAISLLARTEAILCDPIYSGKGLAGLLGRIREGRETGPIVMWHTGGYQALFDPAVGDAFTTG